MPKAGKHEPASPSDSWAGGHTAPWSKITFGQPEAWVDEDPPYFTALRGKDGAQLTQLLLVRQVHAGTGRSFHSTAVRLETSLAVQQESQWSLPLDPRTQRLILHWLRVVREGRRIDQLQRERLQLIHSETQPERLVINSTWTLVAALDVRPGDVIEAGYSYENTHALRPGCCEVFFTVPPQATVGHYRLTVLADPLHPGLAWASSADAPPQREELLPDGQRRWSWEGSQPTPREVEPNQPGSFLNQVWVQVSDLAEWRDLAARVSKAWTGVDNETGAGDFLAFAQPEHVDQASVTRLIQHIQDEFRHLSLDLETGGWLPSISGVVARRRYGDCKDLVWMTTGVLRRWGVVARPILVAMTLREQVASLLPMAALLDHVVLEVEVAGKTRWFDFAERAQGGDFSSQAIAWFGYGLSLDAGAEGLCGQPGERARGVYAVRETILLDSRPGQGSMVEQCIWTEGWQADILRLLRLTRGAEEFARERAQQTQHRYRKARRVGTLHWRDDRVKNICELVEIFEVKDVLSLDEHGDQAEFHVPPNILQESIPLPNDKPRRSPWAMPFPLELRHEITVKAPNLMSDNKRRRRWAELGFSASLEESKVRGAWTKTIHFTVAASEVPLERLTVYRRQLSQLLQETEWRITLPWGQVRIHRGSSFGTLPRPEDAAAAYPIPSPAPVEERARPIEPVIAPSHTKLSPGGGWRRKRPKKNIINISTWAWRIAAVVLVLVILGIWRACQAIGN